MQQLVAVLHSLALNFTKCALNGGKKVCFTTPLPLTFPTNSCKVQIKHVLRITYELVVQKEPLVYSLG